MFLGKKGLLPTERSASDVPMPNSLGRNQIRCFESALSSHQEDGYAGWALSAPGLGSGMHRLADGGGRKEMRWATRLLCLTG